MSQTVANVLVGVLEEIGVKQIFGLIGDSLNPLADAIRRSRIEWVGARHEEGRRGQPLAKPNSPTTSRSVPAPRDPAAPLSEASRNHAPVLALSGDMARKLPGTDFIQTTKPDLPFRDVSLYTETILSAERTPGVIHQGWSWCLRI